LRTFCPRLAGRRPPHQLADVFARAPGAFACRLPRSSPGLRGPVLDGCASDTADLLFCEPLARHRWTCIAPLYNLRAGISPVLTCLRGDSLAVTAALDGRDVVLRSANVGVFDPADLRDFRRCAVLVRERGCLCTRVCLLRTGSATGDRTPPIAPESRS